MVFLSKNENSIYYGKMCTIKYPVVILGRLTAEAVLLCSVHCLAMA